MQTTIIVDKIYLFIVHCTAFGTIVILMNNIFKIPLTTTKNRFIIQSLNRTNVLNI